MRERSTCAQNNAGSGSRLFFWVAGRKLLLIVVALLGLAACADQSLGRSDAVDEKAETATAAAGSPVSDANVSAHQDFVDNVGVAVEAVHLTSAGYVLDLRFKVKDIEKSGAMLDRQAKPYVVVDKSGAKLGVPISYKLGPLRQSTTHPEGERIYFTFFANPGRHVESGDTIRLVVGDFTTGSLTVD
jgi:hypothetical protein